MPQAVTLGEPGVKIPDQKRLYSETRAPELPEMRADTST